MNKSLSFFTVSFVLILVSGLALHSTKTQAQAPSQYPILDRVADKVIQKYQQSTCEQLWQQKSAKASPSPEEQKVIGFLKSDPQARTVFIDKVAAPIANKMFACGMIP